MTERALGVDSARGRTRDVDAGSGPVQAALEPRLQPRGTSPQSTGEASAAPTSMLQLFADAINAGVSPPLVQLDARESARSPAQVHQAAAHGLSGSGGSLPHLAAIQKAFGHHDVSGVQAHVGGRAEEASAAIGARAYASGDQVAFAAAPDLQLAAHEAAHVVQQRGGVRLSGGIGSAGDVYEQHADSVADLVVQGKSAEGLLDQMAHRGAAGGAAVQRDREVPAARGTHAPVTAPSDAPTLLRYAHGVRSHLHDPPRQLVPYARALDSQLMASAFTARPADVVTVVDALLAIRAALATRPPAELSEFRTSGSPLDGMIEDIAPFGNIDQWHALRSAALARRVEERPAAPTGATPAPVPPAPEGTSEPESTIGEHAGHHSAVVAGHEIGDALVAPHDSTAGDIANGIDATSMAYDTFEVLIGVSEAVGIVAVALQPVLSTISLLMAMEDSWRNVQEGVRAQGMRLALMQLDYSGDSGFNPYPLTLTTSQMVALLEPTTAYQQALHMVAYELTESGQAALLMRGGIASVVAVVNTAVQRAEAWPAVRDAIAQADATLRTRIQQDVRRTMYHRIVDAARERIGSAR